MSRYDYQGRLDFVQEKLDEARESRTKAIKDQEKFSKRLLMFDTLVKGANSLINKRADDLMMSQAPQRAKYNQFLQNHQNLQSTFEPYIKKGGNPVDYLTDYYYDMYKTEVSKTRPNAVESSYDAWLREESRKKAETMLPTFNKMQQEAVDVPSYEEFINQYEKYANRVAPRTLAGAAGKFVKNLFNKETEETIAYKNEKAKNVLYDTPLLKEVNELKQAVQDWNAQGNGVVDIVAAINEKAKNGEIVFKDIVDPKVVEWDENSYGSIIKKKGILYITRDANGNKVEKVVDLDLNQYENKKLPVFNETDKKSAYNAAQSVVASFDKKDERVKIFNQVVKNEQLGLTFGSQILEVTTNLGRNPKDVTAQQIATNFLLNQAVEKGSLVGLRTTMTNWDVAQLSPPEPERETEYLKNELLPNIKTFKEDIQSKLGANHPEVSELYATTLKFIKGDSMDLTIDERNEYITDLNKEFGYETSRNLISQDTDDEPVKTIPMPPKKEPMNITEVSSKYKVDEDFINKLISIKPKVGGVAQQAPFREDPIDLVTDKMLYDAGYIEQGKDAPAFKMFGRRKFIRDLFEDLQLR